MSPIIILPLNLPQAALHPNRGCHKDVGMRETTGYVVGQKLVDLANIEAGVIIFGQFVTGRPVEWIGIWAGLALFALLYALGSWLIARGRGV